MIEGYLGKPGGGKSYAATAEILRALEASDSVVVTNVALDLGAVAAYFAAKGRDVDVASRVYVLRDDEAGTFWRVRLRRRSPGALYVGPVRLNAVYDPDLKVPAFPEVQEGEEWDQYLKAYGEWAKAQDLARKRDKVQAESFDSSELFGRPEDFAPHLYVIDECGLLFNSRCWMQRGRELVYWAAQHRKLGDTAVLIVQAASMIDKSLRELAQSWTVFSNGAYRNLGAFVRAPRYVFWRRYTGTPGPGNEPECTGRFSVDPAGVGACYSSRAGVGMRGVGAPAERRARGLHPAFLLAVPVVVALVVWGGVRGVYGAVNPAAEKPPQIAGAGSGVVPAAVPPAVAAGIVSVGVPVYPRLHVEPGRPVEAVRPGRVLPVDELTGYADWTRGGVREQRWMYRSGRVVIDRGGVVWVEGGFGAPPAPRVPVGVAAAVELPAWPPEPVIIRKARRWQTVDVETNEVSDVALGDTESESEQ